MVLDQKSALDCLTIKLQGVFMSESYLIKCDENCELIPNTKLEVDTKTLRNGVVEFTVTSVIKLSFSIGDILFLNSGETENPDKYYKIIDVYPYGCKNKHCYAIQGVKHDCKK